MNVALEAFVWLMAIGGLGGRLLAVANLRRVTGAAWVLEPLAESRTGERPGVPTESLAPRISVCVPARNEAKVIDRLLASLDAQDHDAFEVIVVDDRSEDDTTARATTHRATVVSGVEPPEGWLGKNWALHQAVAVARGDLLLFVDADTWHHPAALRTVEAEMHRRNLDVLVVIGGQMLGTWAERWIQPFFWTLLLSLLNPERSERPDLPDDAMGNGQFACFRRSAYTDCGGHAAVRDRVVEDVALVREAKRKGARYGFRLGPRVTATRMYVGFGELWRGFRKNAAVVDPARPGLSITLTVIAAGLIAQAELWPWMVFATATWAGPAIVSLALVQLLAILAGRFLVYRTFCDATSGAPLSRHPLCYAGQPIAGVVGLAGMLNSLISQLRGTTTWKGRVVKARSL